MDFLKKAEHILKKLSPMKKLLLSYVLLVLIGAFILMLPIATKSGQSTAFVDTLFTATSATCVTGLIRFDTFTYWSFFGQLILLILIQIGGIGFITFVISGLSLTHKKIGLSTRFTLQNSMSSPQLGGVVRMAKFIMFASAIVEVSGAALLAVYYCPLLGFGQGLWVSIFHSISAFCNAGFDLMGSIEPSSSMMTVSGNWYVCTVLMLLVILGGLGFFVWKDLLDVRFRFGKLRLQSKIVLVTSLFLIVVGAIALFLTEWRVSDGMSWGDRILTSLFQSVSARTAGFNSVDLGNMSGSGRLIMICLMLIGGSPGSTAGGVKTVTITILMSGIVSTFKRKKSLEAFGRRFEDVAIRTASCILMTYLLLAIISAVIISAIEQIDIMAVLFETVSAVATVGLTVGITSNLSVVSEIIIAILMLYGRMGSITMLMAFTSDRMTISSKLPLEKVSIG
ncbi:MAG: TrkH family potassium uptake protein [Acutalibacteraceae bacterium]